MNKKILSLFIMVGVFFGLAFSVKALSAKAPTTIPDSGKDVYGVVDTSFDFSKVRFTTSTGEVTNGKNDLKKIKVSTNYSLGSNEKIDLDNKWFSAYCLDPTVSYPDSGLVFQETISSNPQTLFTYSLITAIKNKANVSTNMYNLIATLKGLIFSSFDINVPSEYMNEGNIKYQDIINALYNSETASIEVGIKKLTYVSASSNPTIKEITAEELNTAAGTTGDDYRMTLTRDDILFNKYRVTTMSESKKNYNWALWIIEHSYPTLTLERMFSDIGVSKDNLIQEIILLEGLSDVSEDEANTLLDNYVYSTIQYAIWKSTGSKVNGVLLGNELQGSVELNKIYKYFIEDRDYSKYGSETFKTKINLVKPISKSEIKEETKTSVKYGPYSYTSSMLSLNKINISTTATSGVKLVNDLGEEISSVKVNEQFYVVVEKANKETEIVINASTEGGYTFEPSSNRGRVYYAHDPLTQTVGTGGIIKAVNANHSFNILVNPKTGIDNFITIFVLSLLIFSLAYILIAYRNRPIEL